MSKIVISMFTAIVAVGCTTVIVEYPPADASTADASTNTDAMSAEDATMSPDAADGGLEDVTVVDAATQADAAPDSGPDPICADDPSCCANGQPIRVGLVCGNYPASAQAVCTAAGICQPNENLHNCDVVTACCDGWRATIDSSVACNCVHTGTPVSSNKWGCDPAQVTVGPGNGLGHCGLVSYPTSGFACVSPTQWAP